MDARPPDAPVPVLVRTQRLEIRRLAPGDEVRLQAVFEGAGDHFVAVTGRPHPAPDAAEREIGECARTPGREVALRVSRESGEDVGAAGWWVGNPAPEVALLGMLLVTHPHRRRGVAREALGGLEARLRAEGVSRLRSAVAAGDRRAGEILRGLGFAPLEQRHAGFQHGRVRLGVFERALV
jgi:GNAT superfamily N-acetyltransferase